MVVRAAYRAQRDILAGYGGTDGAGWVKEVKGRGPGATDVPLDTGRQAGFQVKLPGRGLASGLGVGKLVSSPLLILELEPNG